MTTSYARCAVCGARVFESATKDREYADMVRGAGSAVLICASCAESYACKVEPHGLTPQELELKSVFDFIMEKYREAADEIQATSIVITGGFYRRVAVGDQSWRRARLLSWRCITEAAFEQSRLTGYQSCTGCQAQAHTVAAGDRHRLIHAYATCSTVNGWTRLHGCIRATGATYRISDGGYPIWRDP